MEVRLAASHAPTRGTAVPLRLLGDERLARMVGAGQDGAFSVLYERHHQALYRYCRSLVGNDSDAQDALQSALAGALVALRQSQRNAPVRPWLFRIAHNESISLLRRRRPDQELPPEIGQVERSAPEVAEQRARLATLMSDLRELPERQRGALVMRELSGLSHEEVAQALGISVGAAKQTVLEARRSLLEFSEGRAMACAEVQRIISDGDGRALRGRRVRSHLRECSSCNTFAAAIPARRADLMAISPLLPAGAAAGLLAQLTGAGSGSGAGGTGLAAGITGKGLTGLVSGKLLATGVVIVATAAAGTTAVIHRLSERSNPAPATTPMPHAGGAAGHAASRASSSRHGATHGTASAAKQAAARHHAATGHRADRAAGSTARHGRSSTAPGRDRGHSSSAPGQTGTTPVHGRTSAPGQANAPGQLKATSQPATAGHTHVTKTSSTHSSHLHPLKTVTQTNHVAGTHPHVTTKVKLPTPQTNGGSGGSGKHSG